MLGVGVNAHVRSLGTSSAPVRLLWHQTHGERGEEQTMRLVALETSGFVVPMNGATVNWAGYDPTMRLALTHTPLS